jgi:predicted Zn-dependent protease
VQEASTDQAGAGFLAKAGISGKGSLSFFKKLQNQEFRLAIPQDNPYMRTHPLTGERMAMLEELYVKDAAWEKPTDPALEARFQRVKAKLAGFVEDPKRTLNTYPENDKTVPARYARAYAWHKSAYPEKANAEVDALLAQNPRDPYFLELKGQILLESGQPKEALASLREAIKLAPDQPLISALFGHALISTEDSGNFDEAKQVLRAAIGRDNSNPFAWYQLGIIFDREGNSAGAALATAERFSLEGNAMAAMANAHSAMAGLKPGTRECLRAQDIAMASRALIEQGRDKSVARRMAETEKRRPAPAGCSGAAG